MPTAKPEPLRLFLIRHGQTEWSLSGQHTGRTDIPLTPDGEDEARQLQPYIGETRFTRILTSPRERARKTCALAGLAPQAEIEPDLSEWDYGDYEGRRTAEIHAERPDWNIFRHGGPNGETPAEVAARADRLIARLRTYSGNIALFSHGHFGCVLAARWTQLPVVDGQRFSLNSGSLSLLTNDPHHPEVTVIGLWNFTPRGLPHKH